MDEWIPLVQTGMWFLLLVFALVIFRREVVALRAALRDRLAGGAPVKLGAWLELGEVKQQVQDVRGQLDDMSERVTALFLLAMSPAMYSNLRKLAQDHFGPFEATDGLRRELNHLRDLGYIEVHGIRQLPGSGTDLSEFVTITPTGRDFVRLRESLAARRGT